MCIFYIWLLLSNIVFVRLFMLLHVAIAHLFPLLYNIPLYEYAIIQFTVVGLLSCGQVLAVRNNTA